MPLISGGCGCSNGCGGGDDNLVIGGCGGRTGGGDSNPMTERCGGKAIGAGNVINVGFDVWFISVSFVDAMGTSRLFRGLALLCAESVVEIGALLVEIVAFVMRYVGIIVWSSVANCLRAFSSLPAHPAVPVLKNSQFSISRS